MAAARRAVNAAVDAALAAGGGAFTASTKFEVAAVLWLADVEPMVGGGVRSPTALDVYRRMLRVHVLPGLGSLRLGVVSGVCGLQVRRDALRVNAVRDVSRLERGRGPVTRALSAPHVRVWVRMLDVDEYAQRKDLPDLVRFLLATGV